jgi:hypothetical protein
MYEELMGANPSNVKDPRLPVANLLRQRTGRGNLAGAWSTATHEFISEKGGYAGKKFRALVEIDAKDAAPSP